MNHIKLKHIQAAHLDTHITVCGWVRTVRQQKSFSFIELSDGSTFSNIQIVVDQTLPIMTATWQSFRQAPPSPPQDCWYPALGKKQKWELRAESIRILGTCPEEYPLQKKRHSFEFLRDIAHLRPRTNTQGAVLRVRNALSFATHLFFQQQGFLYVQTPIITASDCEGGGEQFLVTTLDVDKPARHPTAPSIFLRTSSANRPTSPCPVSSTGKHWPARSLTFTRSAPRSELKTPTRRAI